MDRALARKTLRPVRDLGNDGLTDRERRRYAARFADRYWRPSTPSAIEARRARVLAVLAERGERSRGVIR